MHELTGSIAAGVALGLAAGASPGPLTTLLVSESLRHGRAAGLRIALVPLLSDPPVVLLAVLLLSRLAALEWILGLVSLTGALFVSYLAWDHMRPRPPQPAGISVPPSSMIKGVLTNWVNPHPYLFWATVGAPLVLRPENRAASIFFIAAFYVCLVGAKVVLALLIARFRDLLVSRWYVAINRALGLALLALAALLLRDAYALLTGA